MTLETDLLLDRQRLKRHLNAWRGAAVVAVAAALILAVGVRGLPGLRGRHVARLRVDGIITEDRRLLEAIEREGRDPQVAAILVAVDSPGGSVGGGEALHDALLRVAARKPVVAVMGGTAASAGYMVSLAAARIFAHEGTLTGSIGVLLETGEISGLLGKLGVGTEVIASGPLKDQPSFTHPTSPEGREVLRGLVGDLYDQFVGMVASARHLDPARVRQLADGRAYTGRQARALGLVDEIGGEPEARAWLARERQVSADLPAEDVTSGSWQQRTIGAILPAIAVSLFGSVAADGLGSGIPMALWQPVGPRGN